MLHCTVIVFGYAACIVFVKQWMGGGPIGPKQKLSCNYVAFQLSALELTLLTTMIMMKMLNQILTEMNIVII